MVAVSGTTEEGRTAWCAPHSIVFFILLLRCLARRFHQTLQRRLLPDTCRIGPDSRGIFNLLV